MRERSVRSHGTGQFDRSQFARLGHNVVIEPGALVFHPENIELGNDVYVGHYAILKGYYKTMMVVGDGSWIGQFCFFHSAGGITIGKNVGIAPNVNILTSRHQEEGRGRPIIDGTLEFAPVVIEDDCDIGIGAIVLPGVTIGRGTLVGAGAVVSRDIVRYSVVAGVPARVLRARP